MGALGAAYGEVLSASVFLVAVITDCEEIESASALVSVLAASFVTPGKSTGCCVGEARPCIVAPSLRATAVRPACICGDSDAGEDAAERVCAASLGVLLTVVAVLVRMCG